MELDNQAQSTALVELTNDDTRYHPSFSSPEADIVLAAKGAEVYFRLHSHNLKTASGFFRQMFTLPQSTQHNGVLYLDEDATTLENLFVLISGLPVPIIDSYDLVEPLLDAIEKYETPGPLSVVRLLVMTAPLSGHPFQLYAAACRFGWDAEAQHASTLTLPFNLHDDAEVRPYLTRLSTKALLRLFDLHRARREGLRKRLNEPPFVSGGVATCNNCGSTIDYGTWRELKYKIVLEMDLRPLGDTILDPNLSEWPEALACWEAKCGQPGCSRYLYDKNETFRVIRECIEKLPKTIDV